MPAKFVSPSRVPFLLVLVLLLDTPVTRTLAQLPQDSKQESSSQKAANKKAQSTTVVSKSDDKTEKRDEPKPDEASKSEEKKTADAESDEDPFALEPGSRRQTDAQWKKKLSGNAFKVMRQHSTESKFSGKYVRSKAKGVYRCAACGAILFSSDQKFESGTGWPSFWAPLAPHNVGESVDNSLPGESRVEIHCVACDGHLGHVFSDGPAPTGLRYCLNSVALKLDESAEAKKLMKEAASPSSKESSTATKR